VFMATTTTPINNQTSEATKLGDATAVLGNKAKEAASNLGDKAEQATHALGSGLESLAGAVREKMPHSGILGTASSSVASGLETGGKYLEKEGLKGMAADLTDLIRRNPLPALLVAGALGYCLACATSRR
jgi:hypothetical protein